MTIAQEPFPIKIHQHICEVEPGTKQAIQILEMKKSFMLWIGPTETPNASLGSLAVSMPNRLDSSVIASTLLKPTLNNESENLSKKLCIQD